MQDLFVPISSRTWGEDNCPFFLNINPYVSLPGTKRNAVLSVPLNHRKENCPTWLYAM